MMDAITEIIKDEDPFSKSKRQDEVSVKIDKRGAYIAVKGYETKSGSDEIIMVENYGGKLRVHIWANKDKEDPTHTINLEGAKS